MDGGRHAQPIRIGLVDLGVGSGVVPSLARRLNRLGRVRAVFRFQPSGALDLDDERDTPSRPTPDLPKPHYTNVHDLLELLRTFASTSEDPPPLVLGLTSVPLAMKEAGPGGAEQWEYDYFGVWPPHPGGQSLDGPPTVGVISTNLWARRYEKAAYRTTEQYLEHVVVAFLGDVLSRGILTHARFRRCVFDYNDDLDSIVDSVRGASLCRSCSSRLGDDRQLGSLAATVGGRRILAAMEAILGDVRKPRLKTVFQVLQQDGTFSILILGIVAAIGINILSQWVTGALWRAVVPVVAFGFLAAWVYWQYHRPPLR